MAERVSAAAKGELSDDAVLGIMATLIGAQIMARATRGRDLSEKLLESANQLVGLAVDRLEKKRG